MMHYCFKRLQFAPRLPRVARRLELLRSGLEAATMSRDRSHAGSGSARLSRKTPWPLRTLPSPVWYVMGSGSVREICDLLPSDL